MNDNVADPSGSVAAVAEPAQAAPPGREQLNPSALTIDQLAHLLTASGARRADAETIHRHLSAGAPVLADGKINLMHYMAWLVREVSHGEE